MTAKRNDTSTAMRAGMARPSQRKKPAAVEPEPPAPVVVEDQAVKDEPKKPPMSKYTALLDPDAAASFDELALFARRATGTRVDKSALLRAMIRLTADDASLREQVITEATKD